MSQRTKYFLLVYDHGKRRLVEIEEFRDGKAAVAAYDAKERPFLRDPSIEVVLLGSDSLDTIKVTHRNYFDERLPDSVAKYLYG